jgi:hypothetical protein
VPPVAPFQARVRGTKAGQLPGAPLGSGADDVPGPIVPAGAWEPPGIAPEGNADAKSLAVGPEADGDGPPLASGELESVGPNVQPAPAASLFVEQAWVAMPVVTASPVRRNARKRRDRVMPAS